VSNRLIILGCGGSAYDVLDTVEAINNRNRTAATWRVEGFLDDQLPRGSDRLGFPVLGTLRDAGSFPQHLFVNAIGSDRSFRRRAEILATTAMPVERFATLVHPSASVSSFSRLGHGVCVHYQVSIGGGVTVGDHVSIHPGAVIGHDSIIDDYVIIAPGAVASGFVRVERSSYLGAASVVRQNLRVGSGALVGMGAVVVKDVQDGATVVGNPARPLASKS
jgi:sugar O-acyltransferase (sialic acid O-acetyltransferase NeuD family)